MAHDVLLYTPDNKFIMTVQIPQLNDTFLDSMPDVIVVNDSRIFVNYGGRSLVSAQYREAQTVVWCVQEDELRKEHSQ